MAKIKLCCYFDKYINILSLEELKTETKCYKSAQENN